MPERFAMSRLLLIVWLLLTSVYTTRGSLNCKEEPCSCCRNGMCADPHKHVLPCQGCIDGYTGSSCYERCPSGCVNCSQLFYEYESGRECYQCKTGFYNGRYKDISSYPLQQDCSLPCMESCETCTSYYSCSRCIPQFYPAYGQGCIKCQANCLQCTSETDCLTCEDGHVWNGKSCAACEAGYFGKNCSAMCPDTCEDKQCNKSTGTCLFCNNGYFMNQDRICLKCPEHCNYCLSNESCFSCTAGYMGETCRDKCSNCKPGTNCNIFTGYCLDGCKNGSSGENCNLPCHLNCSLCERENPFTCVSCASDRYGLDMNCINHCSVKCINGTCSDKDGKCSLGCEYGYWGDKCEYNCSKACPAGKCERSNGSCLKRCNRTDNPDNYTCFCPTNCECDRDYHCAWCLNTYGELCDKPCSEGCVDKICDRKTGECLNGCLPGISGFNCSIGPKNAVFGKTSRVLAATFTLVVVLVLCVGVCCVIIRNGRLSSDRFRICPQRPWKSEETGDIEATIVLSTDRPIGDDQAAMWLCGSADFCQQGSENEQRRRVSISCKIGNIHSTDKEQEANTEQPDYCCSSLLADGSSDELQRRENKAPWAAEREEEE